MSTGAHDPFVHSRMSCVRGGNRALAKLMPNTMKENKNILCCAWAIWKGNDTWAGQGGKGTQNKHV
jgi:hypothetical protein